MKKLLASLSVVVVLFSFGTHPRVQQVAEWAFPDVTFAANNLSSHDTTSSTTDTMSDFRSTLMQLP